MRHLSLGHGLASHTFVGECCAQLSGSPSYRGRALASLTGTAHTRILIANDLGDAHAASCRGPRRRLLDSDHAPHGVAQLDMGAVMAVDARDCLGLAAAGAYPEHGELGAWTSISAGDRLAQRLTGVGASGGATSRTRAKAAEPGWLDGAFTP